MIRLLVDTASDISINNTDNIKVVPLSVTINDKTYLDGYELGHDEFYEMLTSSNTFPKTSQPAPQAYVEAFEEAKEAGDTLLCILLSSGVSGTYQSAVLAKSIVEYDNIYIIDSLTGAYGIKLLVDEALKLINEGKTIEEIVEQLEDLKGRTRVYLSVDTLDYLCRGGRLDKKAAVIGNLVKMKPIITVTREGTADQDHCTFATLKSGSVSVLEDLLAAIDGYDADFVNEYTVDIDADDMFIGEMENTAEYSVPVSPIIIKSVKVTKY